MRNRCAGFTAIELTVVIALIGILAVISVPAFTDYLDSSRLQFSQQILETTLGQAFSHARSHPEEVIVSGTIGTRVLEIKEGATTRSQELERGVMFDVDFSITFLPPYGDIKVEDGVENNETDIAIKGKSYVAKTRVHHDSGLIETIQNGN
jgi:prepilin-type N-terminal cleavage/methylation domain-containing protein